MRDTGGRQDRFRQQRVPPVGISLSETLAAQSGSVLTATALVSLARRSTVLLRGRAALVAIAVTILAGCRGAPITPIYTQDELKAICEQHGARWHPDSLVGGYCESDIQM